MPVCLDADLDALSTMSMAQLHARWAALSDGPVPRVSAGLLRLALAWEIQAAAVGGLPRRVSQKLDQLSGGKTRTSEMRPGMRLVREWQGKLHVVTIGDDGAVLWDDRTWRSLSEVARAITGTRWSGPAFFGLKHKVAAA